MMPFAVLLSASLLSSSAPSYVQPTLTPTVGPVFSATSTNVNFPVTNRGVVFSSNDYSGGTYGIQYGIAWPSNVTQLGFDTFSPGVAGFLNGSTVWVTNGIFTSRLLYLANGQTRGVSLSFNAAIGTFNGSALYFSNYAGGTLGAVCVSNLVALTNARPSDQLYSEVSTNGWTWNPNCFITGVTGYSGLSQYSLSGGNLGKFTAVTKRHAYTAGHTANSGRVYFVGRDGETYAADTRARIINSSEDYCLVLFSNDLPATVEPVMITTTTNMDAKMPFLYATVNNPRPWLETCQHGYVGSQLCVIGSGHVMHVGGDSGNPRFIIVSNTIVNFNGTSGGGCSSNFLADLNALTVAAGLDTNNYQPTIWTLDEYPNP